MLSSADQCAKLPAPWVFVMVRSGSGMTVESVAALLPVVRASLLLVTESEFTCGVLALAATFPVTVLAFPTRRSSDLSLRVQVGSVVHVQPVPLIAVIVSPEGGASVTETT